MATRHVCINKQMFKTFHKVVDEDYLYMINNSSIKVHGKERVRLLFMLKNLLVLRDVYFAPDINRILVSDPVLNRLGYKLVFKSIDV